MLKRGRFMMGGGKPSAPRKRPNEEQVMSNTIEPMRQQGVPPGEDASNATSLTMNAVQVHHPGGPEALRYEAVLRSERTRTHKPGKAILISMLVCTLVCPLTAASTAVTYELRLPNGDDRYYRLEAPNSLPTRKPDPAYPYYSGDRKVSEQEAIVAAIAWAGGMAEVKLPFNGSSNPGRGDCVSLGTAEAGGFTMHRRCGRIGLGTSTARFPIAWCT
jgi:hypothetical protein